MSCVKVVETWSDNACMLILLGVNVTKLKVGEEWEN